MRLLPEKRDHPLDVARKRFELRVFKGELGVSPVVVQHKSLSLYLRA
jgi:hypothetical protein